MSYIVGDLVRVTAVFSDDSGSSVDPTVVKIKIRLPSGSEASYTYGTDPECERDSVGKYHMDVALSSSGTYFYRVLCSGSHVAAKEGFVKVVASQFSAP